MKIISQKIQVRANFPLAADHADLLTNELISVLKAVATDINAIDDSTHEDARLFYDKITAKDVVVKAILNVHGDIADMFDND